MSSGRTQMGASLASAWKLLKAYSIRTSWFTLVITFNPISRLLFCARGQNKFSESLGLLYRGLWIGYEEIKKLSRWHCSHSSLFSCILFTLQLKFIILLFLLSHNFTEQAGFYSAQQKHSPCCTCWVNVSIPAPHCWVTDTLFHLSPAQAQGICLVSPPTLQFYHKNRLLWVGFP